MLHMTRYHVKEERLAPWVKFIWHFEDDSAEIHHKLLPTDSIDVILNLGDEMIYETGSATIAAPAFHVNGLRDEHSFIHQRGSISIFGISFYSYGFYPFACEPLSDIGGHITALLDLAPSLAEGLKPIRCSSSAEAATGLIEQCLASELTEDADCIKKAALIRDFLHCGENISVQEFCRQEDVNIKTFERFTRQYTGCTPLKLRRLTRFQKAGNHLVHQTPQNLVDLAYWNSYADQAHFIREFHRFSGKAPRAFLQESVSIKEQVTYRYR